MTTFAEDLISDCAANWKACDGLEERALLRLAILRDLARELHREKSQCLGSGNKSEAQSLRTWEGQINDLGGRFSLDGELTELLKLPPSERRKSFHIPAALSKAIEDQKFERYDRQWEKSIAVEAFHLGWTFWEVESWVEISSIEDWNHHLNEKLWPNGIVLFVESANSRELHQALWLGRWTLVIHPKLKDPSEFFRNAQRWPGAPDPLPGPIHWKFLLAPPKS